MEEIRLAMEEHMNQMADLIQKFSAELRSSFGPASDNFIGFFQAIDWKCQVYILLKESTVSWATIGKALPLRIILIHSVFSSCVVVWSPSHHCSVDLGELPLLFVSFNCSLENTHFSFYSDIHNRVRLSEKKTE